MALIGEIRKRSWLLIAMIGLAMGGFLLMDMLGQLGVGVFTNPNMIGKIDGQKITSTEFFAKEQDLGGQGDTYRQKDNIWNLYVQEVLMEKATGKLGIDVSEEEKAELFTVGPNISPVVVNAFGGYQAFNPENYNQFKQAEEAGTIDADQQAAWDNIEKSVLLDRKQSKFNTLITQAIYTPTWMAEMENADKTVAASFKFVGVPFASIPDADVEVSNSDISSYIKKYSYKYTNDEETRKAAYVAFDVIPSAQDSAKLKAKIAGLIPGFETTDEDRLYASDNYGTYSAAYVPKDALSPIIADSLFKIPVGSVVGPYIDGREYKAVKLINRKETTDSVSVSHIVIAVQQPEFNLQGMDAANKLIDSLKTLIDNGAAFDTLAVQFSNDPAAKEKKSGDLGFNNTFNFGEDFDNKVLYDAEPNKLYIVESAVGVHLVKVTGVKKSGKTGVQVAYLKESIVPSEETIKIAREKAYAFVSANRSIEDLNKAAAESQGSIAVASSSDMKAMDYNILGLGSNEGSRNLVKWLYTADVGEVSPAIYAFQDEELFYDKKFVIAGLASKRGKGLASAKDMKTELEPLVRNYKKGEMIAKKIKAGESLDAVASANQSSVQDAPSVTFNTSFIPGLGNEPEVLGQVFSMGLNKPSAPIIGSSAVYVVEVLSKTEPQPVTDYATAQKQISTATKSSIQNALYPAMKKQAKIDDRRARFY